MALRRKQLRPKMEELTTFIDETDKLIRQVATVDIMDAEDTIHIPVQDAKHIAYDIAESTSLTLGLDYQHIYGHA